MTITVKKQNKNGWTYYKNLQSLIRVKNKLKISIINQLVLITIAIKAAYHVGQLQHEAATEYKQYQEEIKQKQ